MPEQQELPVEPQIAPSDQNGDEAPVTPDTPETAAADPAEPVAELTDEQKNEQAIKAREERARKSASSVQRRMKEMADATAAERARAEAAERRNDAMLQALLGRQAQPAGNGEPQRDDPRFGGDYEKFIEARAEWRALAAVEQRMAQHSQSWQQQEQQRQQQMAAVTMAQQFHSKLDVSARTVPDFAELMADNEDLEVGNALPAILEAENPAAVMAYFARNHNAADRISRLSPIAAAREVGKIELTLKGGPQVSNAPAPGKPVGSKPGSSSEPPEDPDAYMAWAAKNMR
jgi:hypothetical protein